MHARALSRPVPPVVYPINALNDPPFFNSEIMY